MGELKSEIIDIRDQIVFPANQFYELIFYAHILILAYPKQKHLSFPQLY